MNSNDEEIKLLYLLSGSCDVLPSSYLKLRSYLNIHVSNLADQLNLQLFKGFRNRNKTCPHCYSPWSGDTTSFKLLPSKRLRPCRAQSKVCEEGKGDASESNESRNTLVLKCKVCTKKSLFSLVKTKFVDKIKGDKQSSVVAESVKKKKKKKKRDKSCGLSVNLIKPEDNLPQVVFQKKKKRMENTYITRVANSTHLEDYKSKQSKKKAPVPKISTNKNILPNPYAGQFQQKLTRKKANKLERLKMAIKGEKNSDKKTLKDFLKLV